MLGGEKQFPLQKPFKPDGVNRGREGKHKVHFCKIGFHD